MESVTVLSLAIEHGLAPVKVGNTHGGEYACPCPLCGGRDRFRIWPEQNDGGGSYWCRGCSAHGDRIQFVMDTRNLSFAEAARITGDEDKLKSAPKTEPADGYKTPRAPSCPSYHPAIGKIRNPSTTAQTTENPDLWQEKASRLVEWAAGKVSGTVGQSFLERKGLGGGVWTTYELGFIPEDIYRPRASWGLPEALREDGKPKRLWLPQGVVIPLRNALSGALERIRIRRLDGEPKYYVVPGSTSCQMILGNPEFSAVVVESELDAILIDHVAGDITGVVALGSAQVKPDQDADRFLSGVRCILVALDFDQAGTAAAKWWLSAYGTRAKRWPVPEGKDPGDTWASGKSLREWVTGGWPQGIRRAVSESGRLSPRREPRVRAQASDPLSAPFDADPIEDLAPSLSREEFGSDTGSDAGSDTGADTDMEPVEQAYRILRKHPGIRILATHHRMKLEAPEEWRLRNAALFDRLSRLVFFDPEVSFWLDRHPDGVITRDNFFRR